MSLFSGNGLAITLIVLILAAVWIARGGNPNAANDLAQPDAIEIQEFTPQSLKQYNGVDNDRVLMAIRGRVFDVTPGKAHYGPGGAYSAFAGRDASRGLAKQSFDPADLYPIDAPLDDLADLTAEEREALAQWESFFENKYAYCGKLVEPKSI